VTATASPRSHDRVRSYGADRIVDYTATPVAQALAGQGFDVVLHLAPTSPDLTPTSPEEIAQLVDLIVDGGAFVSTTTPGPDDAGRGVRTGRIFVRSDPDQLAQLVARVDSGDLDIHVAERRPLTQLAAVHTQAASGSLPGKTVLTPMT
jgi:NADPH:quinone reductase-like Zn-dependent oxidoreductase